jgi:hypothetical protein
MGTIERDQRRHDAEFRRDLARHMERGFADANHRRQGRAPRRLESGVVETGDDERVCVARLADLIDETWNGERLVEIALYAGRAEVGIDGGDFDAGRGGGLGGGPDLQRHRARGVGVDDVNAHGSTLPENGAPEWYSSSRGAKRRGDPEVEGRPVFPWIASLALAMTASPTKSAPQDRGPNCS